MINTYFNFDTVFEFVHWLDSDSCYVRTDHTEFMSEI